MSCCLSVCLSLCAINNRKGTQHDYSAPFGLKFVIVCSLLFEKGYRCYLSFYLHLTGSDVSPSLQTLMNTTTGKPPHAASTPSSRHPSSTTGITNMSPDREELTLFRELFQGYDKRLRPALKKEDNVTVTLGISVNQLIDIVSELSDLLNGDNLTCDQALRRRE